MNEATMGSRAFWVAVCTVVVGCGPRAGLTPRSISENSREAAEVPAFEGAPVAASPLPGDGAPEHPYMGDHGVSCMHADGYSTNAHPQPGPTGHQPRTESASMGVLGGECASIQFERYGRGVTVCVNAKRPSLVLFDADTLRIIAHTRLPERHSSLMHLREAMDDTSGGSYFFIDHENRVVVGTAGGTLELYDILAPGTHEQPLRRALRIDLTPQLALVHGQDHITSVMPDWEGRLWFSARFGTVGYVNPDGTGARSIQLEDEEIENSFAVAEDGVYIVSDRALYRFVAGPDGAITTVWRETYDRGIGRKLGQINQGSGTTPTVLGDDYVAIADNAEPRMNILVYRRGEVAGDRQVCAVPVFEPEASATENGLIGFGRSLIVENNSGYDIFPTMQGGRTSVGGIARVDIAEDGSGCEVVWTSDEISQTTVPKLSTDTGLVYLYTKRRGTPEHIDAYYFTAIDFRTGETRFRTLTGVGREYDNNWGAISLSPDGHAYVGVLNGFLRVRDVGTAGPEGLSSPQEAEAQAESR